MTNNLRRRLQDSARELFENAVSPDSRASLEATVRMVLTSCGSGAAKNVDEEPSQEPSSVSDDDSSPEERTRSLNNLNFVHHDHIYQQLEREDAHYQALGIARLPATPKLFPKTTAAQKSLQVVESKSFEDDISAISAHTLERMAKFQQRTHSVAESHVSHEAWRRSQQAYWEREIQSYDVGEI